MDLTALVARCGERGPRRVAVAAAGGVEALQALSDACRMGVAAPVLCGNIELIDREARLHNIDISPFEIIECDSPQQAASIAASLVRQGRVQILMEGWDGDAAPTDPQVLHVPADAGAVVHAGLLDLPGIDRTLVVADLQAAAPGLAEKALILDTACGFARAIGPESPLAAAVAHTDRVLPGAPATVDAAALAVMACQGQIGACRVEGPRTIAPALREADILLFHDRETACAAVGTAQALGCLLGRVTLGGAVPVVPTCGGDSRESKLYALAAACAAVSAP